MRLFHISGKKLQANSLGSEAPEEKNMTIKAARVLLTFSEAVPQAGVPRLQGLLAVKAQQSSLVQAEDDQSESHAFIPLSHFQTADLLQGDTGLLLVALRFVGLVFENQQHEAVWRSQRVDVRHNKSIKMDL